MKTRNELSSNPLSESVREAFEGSSILITGATGVVGLNMISKLVSAVGRDNLRLKIYGVSKSGSLPNTFSPQAAVTMFARDLVAPDSLMGLPKVDFVIHGATYGQPAKFTANPVETILLNTLGTSGLLKLARKSFLFLSTSEIYSGLGDGPYRESQVGTTNTDHPRAAYIEAKRAGEAMTLSPNGTEGTGKVARLSLAYGPGARAEDERVMYQLIARALREKIVTLRGGGDLIRSYLFVEDALQYLLGILVDGDRTIYNVGGTEPVTLETLARKISALLNLEFKNQSQQQTANLLSAPPDVRLDMRKTRELVRNVSHTSLSEGLVPTISWMREALNSV